MDVRKCNPLAYTTPERLRQLGPRTGGGPDPAEHPLLPVPSLRVDARRLPGRATSSDSVALLEGTPAVRLPRRAAHRSRRRVRGARTMPIDWMAPCGGGTRRLSFHVSPDPRIVVQYNVPAGQLG